MCLFLQEGSVTRLETAKITLNDCLACRCVHYVSVCAKLISIHQFPFISGCITSAESVLITQQSQEELYKILDENLRLSEVSTSD